MHHAGVNADFLNEVSARRTPGKWAIVADISEDWVTPIDTRMGALGGSVFRVTRENVEDDQYAKDVATIKADIAQLKAEQAKSRADQKAKLQSKIDNLNTKLQSKLAQAKQRSEQRAKESKAKVDALEKKAAKAKGDTKAAIEKRIADIKERDRKADAEFDKWWNGE
jgi:septal ring factor EnvC (AmiA/AmiB activator)